MKDKRILVFRKALEELVDSLDATLRVASWDAAEQVPEPLKDSASRLVARLGTANRLATGIFSGTVADKARVIALTDAMRRLESAYLGYRSKNGSVARSSEGSGAELQAVLDEVKSHSLGAA